MAKMWKGDHSRRITTRIVIEGDLVLQTPAHFGNGDGSPATDMPLLLDPLDEAEGRLTPLLTGASLAGALRSHLREVESGYSQGVSDQPLCVALFGGTQGDDDGEQSPLIVDDARGEAGATEFRDGVTLNPQSRTAESEKKYDMQLWAAGTGFPMRFELVIRKYDKQSDRMKQALATALAGLSDGGITLGARKQRGYGAVKAENWRAETFDLTTAKGLLDWLERGGGPVTAQDSLETTLGAALPPAEDKREDFRIEATFALDGSLLIRSGGRSADRGLDAVHLSARHPDGNGEPQPVLSGTSLAGALRARAFKILGTLGEKERAKELVDKVWGTEPCASRLRVSEQVIHHVQREFVQNRVSIDRFTGGALDTALFNEQPVFGDRDSRLTLTLHLRQPEEAEIGLLLQLLKDLWTGDLPVGGESSVGRGRLQGISARLIRSGKSLGTST